MSNFTIETHFIPFNFDDSIRRVRVLLPKDYQKTTKKYPVLYMHDGQNVLYNKESYSQISWGIMEALEQTNLDKHWIVVMIDHANERRINDYTPFKIVPPFNRDNQEYHGHEGQYYADFLVNKVKPIMDETYRTLPQRKSTAVCGSSLGGLISAYLASKYSDIFSMVGVFSLASSFVKEDFMNFILDYPIKKKTKFFVQVGTHEQSLNIDQSQEIINDTLDYVKALVNAKVDINNIKLLVMADETHSEVAWRKHLPEFLEYITES